MHRMNNTEDTIVPNVTRTPQTTQISIDDATSELKSLQKMIDQMRDMDDQARLRSIRFLVEYFQFKN